MTICDEVMAIKEVVPSSHSTRVFEIPPLAYYLNQCLTCAHITTTGTPGDERRYCVRTQHWKGYAKNDCHPKE